MINNRELRIGNILMFEGYYIKVSEITYDGFKAEGMVNPSEEEAVHIKPVLLDKNSVLRLGLHEQWGFHRYAIDIDVPEYIQLRVDTAQATIVGIGSQFDESLYLKLERIKYVHELQNLYNILTGNELTINI